MHCCVDLDVPGWRALGGRDDNNNGRSMLDPRPCLELLPPTKIPNKRTISGVERVSSLTASPSLSMKTVLSREICAPVIEKIWLDPLMGVKTQLIRRRREKTGLKTCREINNGQVNMATLFSSLSSTHNTRSSRHHLPKTRAPLPHVCYTLN